ncbi:MAG: putative membrane protein [Patiriisocius sp.]|jgi:uncharacterized membrane protein
MNTLIDKLKNDTFSGIFELSGKAWIPTLISYVVYSILAMLLLTPIILNLMHFSEDDIAKLQEMGNDPFGMSREIEAMSENFATMISPTSYGLIMLVVLGGMLFFSWTYYVALISSKVVIDEGKVDVGKILAGSFSIKVVKLFLTFLAIWIVSTVGFLVISAVSGLIASILGGGIGGLLAVIGSLGWIAFHWRLSLSIPIVAYEDVSIGEAFNISLAALNWSKAFKYTLLSFVAIIVLGIMIMVVALISILLAAIPVVGMILGPVINMFVFAFCLTLIVATLVALYYKYRGVGNDENNKLEDHLLYDN